MNFAGHVLVAHRLARASTRETAVRVGVADADGDHRRGLGNDDGYDLGYVVGSILPDIAAMGRFRLIRAGTEDGPEALTAGVAVHHRTDDRFHRHRWFRTWNGAVSTGLEARGVGRGPARACGHVGVELLLDGFLLDEEPGLRPIVSEAMATLPDPNLSLHRAVAEEHRGGWAAHLTRVAGWPVPTDYRDPDAVAARLARILRARPRLALPATHVDAVAAALAEAQPELERGATDLVGDLVMELAWPEADRR